MRVLLAGIILLSSPALWAQLTAPVYTDAPQLYEGQKVASVELVANPHIDVSSFGALVQQQQPGTPYSTAKVQASIDALKRTERFTKVELQVEPEPAGLKLSFLLQPTFYYGVLEFPGTEKQFRYTRLLQAVNLPGEEPYEEDSLTKAQAALLEFLQKNGFFEAQVHTETQFDDAHQLANIFFRVQLNKRAKVGQVSFDGISAADSTRLLRALHSVRAKLTGAQLTTGKVFTSERIQAAKAYLQSYLGSQDRLIQELRVGMVQFHPDTNHADVVFNAKLGSRVSVTVTGAKLTWVPFMNSRKLHQLIPVFQESSVDPDLLMQGERNLIDYFQTKGYFDVKVEYQVQNLPSKVAVVYQVAKGSRHKVEEVSVEGNHYFPDDKLLAGIPVTEGHLITHGHFSNKLLKQSVNSMTAMYHNSGFEEARVTPQVVDREPKVYVTFQVDEGPQTLVEELHIQGNRALSLRDLQSRQGFNLAPGLPFSPARMNEDRNRIVATYLDRGYPRITFTPKVDRLPLDKHRVNVTYALDEGQQVLVDNLVIVGNHHTRSSYIGRTVAMAPEMPLSQSKMLSAESDLYDLGVFDWASVGPKKPITDETQEEVVAKVHESRRNTITYGVGFEYDKRAGNIPSGTAVVPGLPPIGLGKTKFATSEQSFVSPRGSVEYIRRNMRGLGETFSVSTLIARLDQRLVGSYTQPHFRGSNWRSLLSFSGERTSENPLYTARLGNATVQLERDLTRDATKTLQVRYEFQRTSLDNLLIPQLVLPADRSVRLSGVSASFIHDKRDQSLDAHRGMWDTVTLDLNPSALGSNFSFGRLLARRAIYVPYKKYVWASSLQLGAARPFGGSSVPTSERFFSGGANSLRGFPVYGAGPQRTVPVCSDPHVLSSCSNIHVPVGGDALLIFNTELRTPLPLIPHLGGVIFYDGGNVYDHFSLSRIMSNYTNTVGVGVRYSTPIGPIRFDVGHLLEPVPGFRSTQFFITLGQAF
ncbi:MAG TPA: POTRA domain-containing protein [Terriglobales bacterium]|jgi:outer membrane protein insertion porin family|nr:POTRA domain-containing protein [Terriglobales bacterium]